VSLPSNPRGVIAPVRTIGTSNSGNARLRYRPVSTIVSVPRVMTMGALSFKIPRTIASIKTRSWSVISKLSLFISGTTLTSHSGSRKRASSPSDVAAKEDKPLSSAKRGKVRQNPQPRRNRD
jgi:hypothetical protein